MKTFLKSILFDLDGTLIDSRADLTAAVNFSLESAGLPRQTGAQIVPHIGNGLKVLLSNVFGPVEEAVLINGISAFESYYEAHCIDETVLYADVLHDVRDLSRHVKLGIVTNKPEHFAKKIINALGIGKSISVLYGGDTLPERKPHPRPLLEALRDMDGSTEEALMVGDGAPDIKAGQAAGIRTCVAQYGFGFQPELLDLKPDLIIQSFKDIKEMVL